MKTYGGPRPSGRSPRCRPAPGWRSATADSGARPGLASLGRALRGPRHRRHTRVPAPRRARTHDCCAAAATKPWSACSGAAQRAWAGQRVAEGPGPPAAPSPPSPWVSVREGLRHLPQDQPVRHQEPIPPTKATLCQKHSCLPTMKVWSVRDICCRKGGFLDSRRQIRA